MILAAGRGTRMREAADVRLTPEQAAAADAGLKFLVPIRGRPFIDWVLDEVEAAGFEEVCLVVSPDSPLRARDRDERERGDRDASPRAKARVRLAVQERPRGGADAVLAAEPVVGDADLVVLNADNLYPADVLRLLRALDGPGLAAFEPRALVRQSNIPPERVAAFALIREKEGVLAEIVEKPSPDRVAAMAGAPVSMTCWRFDTSIFDACREVEPSPRGELELVDAVALAMARGTRFRVVPVRAGVLDLSRREDIPAVERLLGQRSGPERRDESRPGGVPPAASSAAALAARLFVPGRIEVLGKHTDYAGGSSLLAAVDRGFTFEARPAAGDEVVIRARATGEEARYRLRRDGEGIAAVAAHAVGQAVGTAGAGGTGSPADPAPMAAPGWARYADGLLDRLAADFGEALRGVHVAFTSTLPRAAGLSSSSALVTGLFLALDAVCRFCDLPAFRIAIPDAPALATWISAAEMGGPVGTRGGSEDHTAILLAHPGHLIRYAFAPVRARGSAPLPAGWIFAIGASGVAADKGGAVQGHYNRLSDLAADAARAWAAATGSSARPLHLGRAREQSEDDQAVLDAIRAGARDLGHEPAPLLRRARHFLEESALVDAAFTALEGGDLTGFAAAANRSAERGAELLENQVPETLALASLARELGAPAASPFGGGFGGAVWALVREEGAEEFLSGWRRRYLDAFPERTQSEFFTTPAGRPADGLPIFT